jgi:3-deoxy-D-manno-octulosonic-acid transferase
MGAALLLLGPFLWWTRRHHYGQSLSGRLGRGKKPRFEGPLWLHAVSVGEVGVAATLVRALPDSLPVLVTTVTPTGQARARALLEHRADVAYLPFDIGLAVQPFFRRHRPRALVLVEGDYWPLVLREAWNRDLPIAVINGRVSDRTFPRLLRFRRLMAPVLRKVERFGLQSALDRDRLSALGVPNERLVVTGNLKFETRPPSPAPELTAWIDGARAATGRPIWIVGSTMPGEEDVILSAWERSGRAHVPVLAPRHPERFDEIARWIEGRSLRVARRSSGLDPGNADVLLLDTLGELAALYACADAATVGGTLVPTGGHNPLEPAAAGVPIAVGPHMENFREIAEAFDTGGAWRRVTSAEELGATLREWAANPAAAQRLGERGRAVLDAHAGGLERTLELLRPVLALWDREIA